MDPTIGAFTAAAALFVALATLQIGLFVWLRADMRRMEERLRAEMAGLESRTNARFERLEARMDGRFERLEARMAAMEHGQAKLEGLLEGLREAIAGRARQAAE